MKQLATAYSYAPVQRTVTLTGLNVPLGYILLVVNATRGQIIYNLADPLLAAASYLRAEDSVLTLNSSVDTSLHSASDDLTIFYDNGAESQMVLVQGPAGPQGIPGTTSWLGITDKPASFPASEHTHLKSEITGLDADLADLSAADTALGERIDYLTENLDPAALDSIAEAAASIGAIQTQLDTHQHTASDITDFATAVVASAPALAITASTRVADGTATTFPVSGIVSNDPAHVLVALNGVTQAPGTDYTVSEASGTITFDAAPAAGTQIAATALGLRSVQPPIDPTLYLFAFDSSPDGLTTYSGRLLNADRPAAPALPETATTWTIRRATLNAAGRVLTTATATGSWANRESLSFQ